MCYAEVQSTYEHSGPLHNDEPVLLLMQVAPHLNANLRTF